MSDAQQFQAVARSSDAASESVEALRQSMVRIQIEIDRVARGTSTGTDSQLHVQLTGAHEALRAARAALSRANQAAKVAAVEAAAREERQRASVRGR